MKGYESHHKLPIRLGGTDDKSNIVILTVAEHKQAHLDLYNTYGDYRDLCAYHMIGYNHTKAHSESCSIGGLEAARRNKELGRPQGFQGFDPEYLRGVASMGGKIGGKVQHELGIGIHSQEYLDSDEYLLNCSKGGFIGCESNGWRDSAVQSENGERGGKKNAGFKWYNDGVTSYKYQKWKQDIEPYEEFLSRNNFQSGRIQSKLTCPHCGLHGNAGPIGRWHFDNCQQKANNED